MEHGPIVPGQGGSLMSLQGPWRTDLSLGGDSVKSCISPTRSEFARVSSNLLRSDPLRPEHLVALEVHVHGGELLRVDVRAEHPVQFARLKGSETSAGVMPPANPRG